MASNPKKTRSVLIILATILVGAGLFVLAKKMLDSSSLRPDVTANSFAIDVQNTGNDATKDTQTGQTEKVETDSSEDASTDSEASGVDSAATTGNTDSAETTADGQVSAEESKAFFAQLKFYDAEGKAHSFSDFEGKTIVVNYWASWCGPCQHEMPDIQKFYDAHKDDEDFVFISINSTDGNRETKEKADAYMKDNGFTFPYYYDNDLDIPYKLGLGSLPTTFSVLRNGAGGLLLEGAYGLQDFENLLQQSQDIKLPGEE